MKVSNLSAISIFTVVIALIFIGIMAVNLVRQKEIQVKTIKTTGTAQIGGSFELLNQDGQIVTDKNFHGKHLLMFFGFTNCPDVCPMSMNEIAMTLKLLKDKSDRIQAVFVSVDPERDTPNSLSNFIGAFDKRIMGLTGTIQQITKITQAYRVYFQKVTTKEKTVQPETDINYQVDHSAITYLMSPSGEFIRHFPYGTNSEEMANDILSRL